MNNTWLHWRYKGFINIRAKKVLNDLAKKGDKIAKGYLKKYVSHKPTAPSFLQINTIRGKNQLATANITNNNSHSKFFTKNNESEEIFITKRNCKPRRNYDIDYNKRIFSTERERCIYNNVPFFSLNHTALNWLFPMRLTKPDYSMNILNDIPRLRPKSIKLSAKYTPLHTVSGINGNVKKKIVTIDHHTSVSVIRQRITESISNNHDNGLINSIDISNV